MPKYYQPEIETASREQILTWQNERLVAQVRHVWDNVPYYRKKMEEKGVTPEDIQGVADLSKLPFPPYGSSFLLHKVPMDRFQ